MPFLYVAHLREFRRHQENVWKIGYTDRTLQQRLRGYPKGSLAVHSACVSDGRAAEAHLIKLLDAMPEVAKRRDLGREYYEAPLSAVYGAFCAVGARYGASMPLPEQEREQDQEYEVQDIVGRRVRGGREEFKVLWRGYSEREATWEPRAHLSNAQRLLRAYLRRSGGGFAPDGAHGMRLRPRKPVRRPDSLC